MTNITSRGKEIRGNVRLTTIFDGIYSHNSSPMATGNLFIDGATQGFGSFSSAGFSPIR